MAAQTTTTFDNLDESLASALWFIRHRRFVMALCTLRLALAEAHGDLRNRIGGLIASLEGASVAELAA